VEELRAAGLLRVAGGPPPAALEWGHLQSLPYINAVIRESMRLCTTSATGSLRCGACDQLTGL
jgi:hypothetical protein